jgi:hypothetical protein
MTGTDGNGDYRLHLPMGTHDVHVSTLFNWATASIPAAYTVQLPEADTTVTGLDFAAAVGSATDRRIQATSLRPPRPGFDRTVRIDWEVASAIPAGSTIYLQTDPAETMVWSSIPPTSVDGTLYAWEIAPEDVVGTLLVSILTDASTPLGIWLHGIISIYPVEGDHDPVNNFAKLADDQVVGSYDPNDKQVFPAFLTPDEVASDTVVDYLVRFQNTGTYHAERVLITDTLSTDLRWETFRSVQSSHPCEWFLREGVAHFVFNDIMLPDSNANEPESHGFVRFKIRPRVGMVAGESITNVANIYFDFNEPVITEPCVLAVEIPTVVVEPPLAPVLVLFPVPVTQHVRVMMPDGPYRGQVLSADGRVVLQLGTVLNNASVDLGGLAPGQYVVQLHGENGLRMNARFMKQ